MSEHSEQAIVFQYARLKALTDPRWSLLFAIPNGGQRSLTTARKLKAEGVEPGVPDMFFALPVGNSAGLFIEMKFGKNKLSSLQEDWLRRLERVGYATALCYCAGGVIDTIESYMHRR